MHTKKQIGRVIGIILSLFLLFSLEGRAQDKFHVNAAEGDLYTYQNGVLIVTKESDLTISSNEQTNHTIVVKSGIRATITLDGVNIRSENCPFYIEEGANVTIIISERGSNLESNDLASPAIRCRDSELTIMGNGSLQAKGGQNCAGIGGADGEAGGRITIKAGIVTATGGGMAAGIGGGCEGAGGNITIEGGTVNATGGQNAAGIGGGRGKAGGTIKISGGTVKAKGGVNAAGIGGGFTAAGGKITICGGIVTATGGDNSAAGIGSGAYHNPNEGNSFTTDNPTNNPAENPPGNAFIQATSISDRTKVEIWSGVIFEGNKGNTGKVYGNPTLPKGEITIPSDKTLDIDEGKTLTIGKGTTLTIGEGTTLTNNGVIGVAGTLTNNGGTYQGSGKLYKLKGGTINGIGTFEEGVIITFDANAGDGDDLVTNLPPTQIIKKETEPTIAATPTRTNYTLVGWSTTANGSPITNLSDVTNTDVELFALWKRNTTLELNANSYSYTYGDNAPTVEATLKVEGENNGSTTETISYSFYSEVECINYIKTSDVKDARTYYVKASYPGDNNNMEAETAAISYKITKKELTVTPTAGQTIYLDEHPAFTVSGAVSPEEPAFTGKLGVSDNSPKKITKGNLELADGEKGFKAANYTWKLSSPVEITVEDQTLKDALIEASSLTADWMKDKVTLIAPANFMIAAVSPLRSATAPDWKAQIEIEKAGDYDFECQLKRDVATSVYTIFIPIKLDNIVPTINVAASNLSVTVDLSDNLSGLASCTYNWNNGGDQSVTLTPGENTKSFTLTGAEGIYPLIVTLTDQVGNEATYVGQVTLKENRPTPPPTPTPIYYTVSLPAVEGAITDPAAGDHPVESWDSFSFTIALDADYSESVPLVTVDGTVLTPRESDGKYIIKWVRHDMAVEISGIVKNIPTGTDDIQASAVDIRQSAGVLCIDTPQPLEGKIYSAAGTELRTLRLSAGTNRVYGLPQGVCIIRLSDETTRKVVIATH